MLRFTVHGTLLIGLGLKGIKTILFSLFFRTISSCFFLSLNILENLFTLIIQFSWLENILERKEKIVLRKQDNENINVLRSIHSNYSNFDSIEMDSKIFNNRCNDLLTIFFPSINHFYGVWKRERNIRHFPALLLLFSFSKRKITTIDRNQFHPWPKADHHCPKWCEWWSLRDHPVYLTTFSLHAEKSEPTCHRKEKGGHPNVSPAWRCLDTSRLTNTCYYTYYTYCPTR